MTGNFIFAARGARGFARWGLVRWFTIRGSQFRKGLIFSYRDWTRKGIGWLRSAEGVRKIAGSRASSSLAVSESRDRWFWPKGDGGNGRCVTMASQEDRVDAVV